MGLFGKAPDPKEQVQEWGKKIRKEGNNLDRQINAIKREEMKVTKSLKEAAKKGDKDVCHILAKEIINSRKAVTRLYTAKANLNSVQLQMKGQLATVKIAGALSSSAEVMKSMNALVKLPETQKAMMELSREMMKAGVIEEMLETTMEGLDGEDDMEEAAQEEVDKIILELTTGKLGEAPTAVKDTLPAPVASSAKATEESEESEGELEEMQNRLEALRS
jgi:charged multivesicular body protein 3